MGVPHSGGTGAIGTLLRGLVGPAVRGGRRGKRFPAPPIAIRFKRSIARISGDKIFNGSIAS